METTLSLNQRSVEHGHFAKPKGWLFHATLVVTLFLSTAAVLEAQSGTIRGTVIGEGTREPLPGAQVFIPGTGIGSLSSQEGEFLLLNVPAGQQTVQVQMIGYGQAEQAVNIPADGTATVEFELTQSAIALDEIVVTGAGQATERKRLGNTVGTINTEEIENAPTRSVSEVLQGREPGVVVTQSGGMAGEGSRIRIRGSSSLSQSNQPLVYIDGVRIASEEGFIGAGGASRLDDLNPESIARVEILKGAAAATLYGTEASNGVIQIFTKRGQDGAARWELNVEQGFSGQNESRYEPLAGYVQAEEPSPRLNSQDIGTRGVRELWGLDVAPYEVFTVPLTPLIFETGHHQAYSLSVSGGADRISYYASGRYARENGTFGATEYGPAEDLDIKRQANANLSIFPLENMRLRLTSFYSEGHHAVPTNGNDIYGAFSLTAMSKPEFAGPENPTGAFAFSTLPELMQIIEFEDFSRFGGTLTASYTPAPTLNVETTFGIDRVNTLGVSFRRFGWNVSGVAGANPQGEKYVQDRIDRNLTFDTRASWNTDLTDNVNSAFVAGVQLLSREIHESVSLGEQFPAPGLEVTEAGAFQSVGELILETAQWGLFGQEQIGFGDYLFLTGGVRYDNHSAFGEGAGGALYPKVSFSFVPSDMPGWGSSLFSALRLRGAIGQSGLQPGAFDKFTTFSPLPAETGPGVQPDNLGNPDLEPEVSTEWETGFELGFFNNRAALQGTYWNRTTSNVLVARQFPPSGGFVSPQLDNLGEMHSWGIEMGLNGNAYTSPSFSVDLFATASYLDQEITDLGGAPPIKIEYFRYRTWHREGYAPGAYFGPKLIDAPYPFDTNGDGQPDTREQVLAFLSQPRSPASVPLLLVDEDGDGDLLDHYLGSPHPNWQGAFGTDISFFGDFQLGTLFEYKAGHVVHDLTGAFRTTHPLLGINTRETAQIDATLQNPASTPEERLDAALAWSREGASLAPNNALNMIKPGDFIRWRELSLTYQVPENYLERFGARSLALTASARNLMLWTKYTGIDPESVVVTGTNYLAGIDGWRPGTPRRFTFSARVGF